MSMAGPLASQIPPGSLPQPEKTMTADEVMRIRTRYKEALRAGMSVAEATAYANGPDLAEPSVPVVVLDDGEILIESSAILDYLNELVTLGVALGDRDA